MKEYKDKIFLERIFESTEIIEDHLLGFNQVSFKENKKTYDAVLMQLITIGEMVNRLSDEFKEKNKDYPWHEIIGMRNQIAHGYFEIKTEEVWETAINDVLGLKKKIQDILTNS